MPKLFIANTTKQNLHLHLRIPGKTRLVEQHVKMGGQVQVLNADLDLPEIDAIIEQLEDGIGAVAVSSIDRSRDFIGIAYSIDKPVNASVIERAVAQNDDFLTKRGAQLRHDAAVATGVALKEDDPGLTNFEQGSIKEVRPDEAPAKAEAFGVQLAETPTPPRRGRRKAA